MKKIFEIEILRVGAVLALALMAGCSGKSADEAAAPGGAGGGMGRERGGPTRVMTVEAAIKPIKLVKQYVGGIQPNYSVDVRSNASGWLTSVKVDTGDRVNKNDVVCVVEHEDVQAQVDQAEANISVAKASVARAQAELENVALETGRAETLFEKGYMSKRDLEQAQTAKKQAAAALDASKGQLAQAEAQLKNIQVRLRDMTIRAPFSGVVAQRFVDPGAYVSPSANILRIVDDSSVKAVINVVEEDFPSLNVGASATLSSDSYPGRVFEGNISRVSPAIDTVSRTAPVEILVPNEGRELRTGMTARVNLVVSERAAAVVVPESALRRDAEAGRDFVYTVADGLAKRLDVTAGIRSGGEIEIVEGLEAGRAVVVGDVRLNDGMQVEVAEKKGERN